jgi:hypothetical protein
MSLDQQPFDRTKLNHIDLQLRRLVDESYDFCIYKCTEKNQGNIPVCKSNCFKTVIVPYRFNNHVAKEEEENLYKKCLSEKFPNIKHSDYITCSQSLYKDRIQVLSKHLQEVAENVL